MSSGVSVNSVKKIFNSKCPVDTNNKTKHLKLKKLRLDNKTLPLLWKSENLNDVITKNKDNRSTKKKRRHHARQFKGYPFSSETDSDIEQNEAEKIKKGVAGHRLDIKEEASSMQQLELQPKAFIAPSEIAMKGNRPHKYTHKKGLPQKGDEEYFWGSEELGPVFPMLSHEAVNFSKESLTESDKIEFEALCPSICPSRDVMVCGKCQHGIYKTFISVCHLRMFTCNHEDETLQLISRYPCVLSAPYISDAHDTPKVKIQEPGDDDKVLRFIMCRNQGKLGTDEKPSDDPRCNFRATKESLKYYDFKGVNVLLDAHLIHYKGSSEY